MRERELIAVRHPRVRQAASAQMAATLEALRAELTDLREIAEREQERRAAAEALSERLRRQLEEHEARSGRAFAALDDLRDQIGWVREAYAELRERPLPAEAAAPSNGGVELHRLDAARTRLREQTPALSDETVPSDATAPAPAPSGEAPSGEAPSGETPSGEAPSGEAPSGEVPSGETPPGEVPSGEAPPESSPEDPRPPFTLAPVAERDLTRAGRLLLELLPAQGLVHPSALAYDLILDPSTCVRVDVADGGATDVKWMHTSRAPEAVRFQLEGDPVSIVRLLTGGARRWPLRRRRRRARVRGDRTGVHALRELIDARLPLSELERAGVRVDALGSHETWTNRATSG